MCTKLICASCHQPIDGEILWDNGVPYHPRPKEPCPTVAANLQPLREKAKRWHDAAQLVQERNIENSIAFHYAEQLKTDADEIDAWCDAAEARIQEAVDEGYGKWVHEGACHELACGCATIDIADAVRTALIGSKEPVPRDPRCTCVVPTPMIDCPVHNPPQREL